jgi:hypothetical protein
MSYTDPKRFALLQKKDPSKCFLHIQHAARREDPSYHVSDCVTSRHDEVVKKKKKYEDENEDENEIENEVESENKVENIVSLVSNVKLSDDDEKKSKEENSGWYPSWLKVIPPTSNINSLDEDVENWDDEPPHPPYDPLKRVFAAGMEVPFKFELMSKKKKKELRNLQHNRMSKNM